MRGERVIVRAFDGEPLIRLIWEVSPTAVYICSEEGYQRLLAGGAWIPGGFPRNDVFRHDATVAKRLITSWQTDPDIWKALTIWGEESMPMEEGEDSKDGLF